MDTGVAKAVGRLLGGLLCVLLVSGTAWGRDHGRAEEPEDSAAVKARALYRSGTAHYNLAEYKEALIDYKEGYRLKSDPAFLFNLGQCHRQLGEPEEAAIAYRAYLRSATKATNRREVEQFIADADAAALAKAKEAARPPQGTQSPQFGDGKNGVPAEAISGTAPEKNEAGHSRTWVWVVVGVGALVVAGAAVGLGFGLSQRGQAPDSTLGNAGGL